MAQVNLDLILRSAHSFDQKMVFLTQYFVSWQKIRYWLRNEKVYPDKQWNLYQNFVEFLWNFWCWFPTRTKYALNITYDVIWIYTAHLGYLRDITSDIWWYLSSRRVGMALPWFSAKIEYSKNTLVFFNFFCSVHAIKKLQEGGGCFIPKILDPAISIILFVFFSKYLVG